MGGEKVEHVIAGVGKLGFDMELDGMKEYVAKTTGMSKIDQVLNFYGIPYSRKNNYKAYLRYKPRESHCVIINDYFLGLFRSGREGFDDPDTDYSNFDYQTLQQEYNDKHPEDEQTGLDLHVNYGAFTNNEKEHLAAIKKEQAGQSNEEMKLVTDVLKGMMTEMNEIKKTIGLLSPNTPIQNDNSNSNTTTPHEIKETGNSMGEREDGTASSGGDGSTKAVVGGGEGSGEIGSKDGNKNLSSEHVMGLDQSTAQGLIIPSNIAERLGTDEGKGE